MAITLLGLAMFAAWWPLMAVAALPIPFDITWQLVATTFVGLGIGKNHGRPIAGAIIGFGFWPVMIWIFGLVAAIASF